MPAEDLAWTAFLDAWMQAQRLPWELLAAWQRAWLALQQELVDEWVCRWAGGVPIDG
jgi:hypothetical protein